MVVADASIVLEWIIPTNRSAVADRVWKQAKNSMIVVPALWLWEVHSVVLKLYRQRKLSDENMNEALLSLAIINKRVDSSPTAEVVMATWDVATAQMLTFYDSSYIELALRLGLPLASMDSALLNAAKRLGVKIL